MSVLTPSEIRERIQKLWDGQRLLKTWLTGETLFPYELSTRLPTGRELADPVRFGEVRSAVASLRAGSGYALVDEVVSNRQVGSHTLPTRVVVEDLDQALRLIGKAREFGRFERLVAETRQTMPDLEELLRSKPLAVLEIADAWPRLMRVCAYLREHPRPGCYLREIDLPGIDTKFLEAHKGVLSEMLDAVLPPEAVDAAAKGVKVFERRYGFRYDPPGIRFRWLDPALAPMGLVDMVVPVDDFIRLDPPVERVFITENKVNFLAFPALARSMVVFGQGYGIHSLAEVPWFSQRTLIYWGDLDTHGFAILSRLRQKHPGVRSLLMDDETLEAHRDAWGQEPPDSRILTDLAHLTHAEAIVYQGLRDGRWGERLRLEQERIGFGALTAALANL